MSLVIFSREFRLLLCSNNVGVAISRSVAGRLLLLDDGGNRVLKLKLGERRNAFDKGDFVSLFLKVKHKFLSF